MTNYAIHSFHAPAILYRDGKGSLTGDDPWFPLPEPLHIAESKEAAETWRKENSNVG